MLNENILEGKWKMVKGQIRKAWGNLTEDEVEQTKGDVTKIAGLVQQRYGENQESIREKINSFLTDLGDTKVGAELKPDKN
ncbi:CsbD family protein [soil metagenome]